MHKHYGALHAVDGIDLRVERGEIFGLIGHNGAGKSTLFKMILGLVPATSGDIRVSGATVQGRDFRAARRHLGYLPENVVLYDNLNGLETLHFFARLKGAPLSQCQALLDRVGLAHAGKRSVREYSKGMRQRLGFAQALLGEPRLLLLDEPTTGLDPQARHLMWERLQLLLQQGTSILLTTHFMDEAERLCSRLLVLDHGKKIAEGKPRELIAQHLESDVVEVFGVGAVALAEDANLRALAARVEISGETVFFYTQNAQPLLQALGQHGHLRTLHRPANLEDLFLKLTGRQIRE